MACEQTFGQKLQPHVGELVRVCYADGGTSAFDGKIGLLMSVAAAASTAAVVEVLIEERVRSLLLFQSELEFLGADDE